MTNLRLVVLVKYLASMNFNMKISYNILRKIDKLLIMLYNIIQNVNKMKSILNLVVTLGGNI